MSADWLRYRLAEAPGEIRLLLNCPGGDAEESIAMYHLLAAERERITVEVIGLAASGGSLLALAGKKCIMYRGTRMMIHDPLVWMGGRAAELRQMADDCDAWAADLSQIYGARSSMSAEDALAAMRAETWYTSEQAREVGLCDEISESPAKLADPPEGVEAVPEVGEDAVVVAVSMVAGGTGLWQGLYRRLPAELSVGDTAGMDEGNQGAPGAPANLSLVEQVRRLSAAEHTELAQVLGMVPQAQHDAVTAQLGDMRTVNEGLRSDLDNLNSERGSERAEAAVERFLSSGQIRSTDREYWLGRLKADYDNTSTFLAEQPQRAGFGGVRGSSHGGDDDSEGRPAELSAEEKSVARTLGLSDDEYRRYGADGDARKIAEADAERLRAESGAAGGA